jgi:hypothetical protein
MTEYLGAVEVEQREYPGAEDRVVRVDQRPVVELDVVLASGRVVAFGSRQRREGELPPAWRVFSIQA